jgi:AcrR family transcriptional regulator
MESALDTFARFGYRKTSMEEIAKSAEISRPGLYFLFDCKQDLFRSAVIHLLTSSLLTIENTLADTNRPLRERLLDAFGCWVGRYIGPAALDVSSVMDENPLLLEGIVPEFPERFAAMITEAIRTSITSVKSGKAEPLAQTIISLSVGLKHQVSDRKTYLERLSLGVDLLLPDKK